jgi:hypothetical protein
MESTRATRIGVSHQKYCGFSQYTVPPHTVAITVSSP